MTKRKVNFELLRILAMLMVVTMHYLSRGGSLPEAGVPLTGRTILGAVLESVCIVAVNVYVLISGYFLGGKPFKISRLIELLCQIWFYAAVIPCILYPLGVAAVWKTDGIYGLIQYIFPIGSEHYWFATAYVLMYLFIPVMNSAISNLPRKQMDLMLTGILVFTCGIKSVVPVQFPVDRYGYDALWFMCVYLIGAYIAKYGIPFLQKGKGPLLLYLGSVAAIFGVTVATHVINSKTGALAYYSTVPYHYNFILCLTGAVGLFGIFAKCSIKEGRAADCIRFVGPLSFGVYLFHEHIDIRNVWYGISVNGIENKLNENLIYFLFHLIITIVIVFALGILFDYIRSLLFKIIKKGLKTGWRKLTRDSLKR